MNRSSPLTALLLLALALPLGGCPSTRGRAPPLDPCLVDAGEGNRPFHAGSTVRREKVEALVASLPEVRGEAFLELARKILAYGECAVPPLLEALASSDPLSREHAAYLLGVLKDRRTVPALAVAAQDEVARVRYEAAAALLELRDPRGLAVLVDGLEDADARARAKCLDVLAERTGQRFGFEADGDPCEREAAVRRWRGWLAQRAEQPDPECDGTPLLDPIEEQEKTRGRAKPVDPLRR